MTPCVAIAVFDLDGTILRERTVCELIAARLGQLDRMRELERATTTEEIRRARHEIVSWYRGRQESELVDCLEDAVLAPGAAEGITSLMEAGVEVVLASITWRFAVDCMARRLGIKAVLGTYLDSSDWSIARHSWPRDKAAWITQASTDRSIPLSRIGAVGDSVGDIPMLSVAGRGVFVGSSAPPALPDHVCHAPSADLRDVADYLLGC